MAVRVGAVQGPGKYLHVTTYLESAAGLNNSAVISVAGVQVGRVESLSVDFNRAKIILSIDESANIRTDATVVLRARSVLGEKYIELVPHQRDTPLLKEGDELTDTQSALEIDQMVTRLGPLIGALDPESLKKVGASFSAAIEADPDRPARMLIDTEILLHSSAVAAEQLPDLIREARGSLKSVQRTADEARPVLHDIDQTVLALRQRIDEIPPEQLAGILKDVEATAASAQHTMAVLDQHSAEIEKVLSNLQDIDKWELRRLLREEGILVRLKSSEVVETP